MIDLTVEERVQNGIAWLDENRPGWREKINLVNFDITYPCKCVLGQVFHDEVNRDACWKTNVHDGFDYAFQNLMDSDHKLAVYYGFDSSGPVGDYPALQAEWERRLA